MDWERLTFFSHAYPTPNEKHGAAEQKSNEGEIEDEYVKHIYRLYCV
jgi:hypothetical protein